MSTYADRCECAYAAALPATLPWRVVPAYGGVRADYRCERCGNRWHTCWISENDTPRKAA